MPGKSLFSVFVFSFFSLSYIFGQSQMKTIDIASENWLIDDPDAEVMTYMDQKSLYLYEGVAHLKDVEFENGVIEVDIAPHGHRGFAGIVFRYQSKDNYELFYIRPHKSGLPDALQYTPVFNGLSAWQLYSNEGYTAKADIPANKWVHLKMVISGTKAYVYLDHAPEPHLVVPDLKHGMSKGSIGLWGRLGAVNFANFRCMPDTSLLQNENTHPFEMPNNDWPRWRGPNYDGISLQEGVFNESYGLKIAWKKKLGSGYSAISIADGQVITMFSENKFDYLISLDAGSGEEQWRFRIDSTYAGRDGANDGPISTPTIDAGKVYGLGPKGQLFALDLKTGKKIWSAHLMDDHHALQPHWGFTTSPLITGDLVVVATGGIVNNAISAFNKNSGELLWASANDRINYQSPILITLSGKTQLICAGDNYLYGFDPESGEELWKYRHGGRRFYRRILNPVLVEDNKLFLTYRPSESKLIEVKSEQDQFVIEEIWTSKHLNRNYNIPVYHEGYIYGYSGDFLTCIEAKSGELVWKSRPPGNGFTILVDGHLVVLTKKGSLHIAKASPAGYHEIASLQLFDKLTWTPPSFANGKIYARSSFDKIAGVEIVPVKQIASKERTNEIRMQVPNSEFAAFVKSVEKASDKKSLIEQFMNAQKQFPVLEGDSLVHIVYRGAAKDLALRGDMFDASEQIPWICWRRLLCPSRYE